MWREKCKHDSNDAQYEQGILTGGTFWLSLVGTSASPLTCNICAVFRKSDSCSWPICTSPLYIKRRSDSMSFSLTSRKITMGCWQGFALRSLRKYGLQAERTTLWAVKEQPSHANVTSTKSSSSRKWRKDERMLAWKSFQRRLYCCSGSDTSPIWANKSFSKASGRDTAVLLSQASATVLHSCEIAVLLPGQYFCYCTVLLLDIILPLSASSFSGLAPGIFKWNNLLAMNTKQIQHYF